MNYFANQMLSIRIHDGYFLWKLDDDDDYEEEDDNDGDDDDDDDDDEGGAMKQMKTSIHFQSLKKSLSKNSY